MTTSIDDKAFEDCMSLTKVTIPSSITTIGNYSFSRCSLLTTVVLPSTITSIGRYAFSGCSSLTKIALPLSVTSIGASAFSHCSSLLEITLSSNVTSPRQNSFFSKSTFKINTFFSCSALTMITLPPFFINIGYYSFKDCTSLVSLCFTADPSYISITTLSQCPQLTTIEAPSFATTTFNKNPEGFQETLLRVGFSLYDRCLLSILIGGGAAGSEYPVYPYQNGHSGYLYCNIGLWARTRVSENNRLPLCNAAAMI